MRICRICSKQVSDDRKICRDCGAILEDIPDEVVPVAVAEPSTSFEQSVGEVVVAAEQSLPPDTEALPWKCSQCGETVPGTFDICWKCQTTKDGENANAEPVCLEEESDARKPDEELTPTELDASLWGRKKSGWKKTRGNPPFSLDSTQTTQDNLRRFREENLFGRASRSRVADILNILRQRYLSEEAVTKALVVLVGKRVPATSLDRVLFFHTATADPLLHDAVTEILVPLRGQGTTDVGVSDIQRVLTKWVAQGRTPTNWSEPTTVRVAQGLLSTLRDFGVLQGAVHKRIAPAYLPVEAFAYLAFYLKQHHPSAAKLLELPDWKLFFLPVKGWNAS